MPRLPRYLLPDGLYHVTGRAVFDSPLFADDDDRRVFLWLMRRALGEFHVECLGYCLMGTHYHLLLAGTRADLSQAMHRLNGRYLRVHRRQSRQGGSVPDRRRLALDVVRLPGRTTPTAIRSSSVSLCARSSRPRSTTSLRRASASGRTSSRPP
jgi:REP element-mobilizing transposase RayT